MDGLQFYGFSHIDRWKGDDDVLFKNFVFKVAMIVHVIDSGLRENTSFDV